MIISELARMVKDFYFFLYEFLDFPCFLEFQIAKILYPENNRLVGNSFKHLKSRVQISQDFE